MISDESNDTYPENRKGKERATAADEKTKTPLALIGMDTPGVPYAHKHDIDRERAPITRL
jgi:hypothetical protein